VGVKITIAGEKIDGEGCRRSGKINILKREIYGIIGVVKKEVF